MEQPPVGSIVRDREGDRHQRDDLGWVDLDAKRNARTFIGSWQEFLRWYGPVTVDRTGIE